MHARGNEAKALVGKIMGRMGAMEALRTIKNAARG
jgi:hypothetical protein